MFVVSPWTILRRSSTRLPECMHAITDRLSTQTMTKQELKIWVKIRIYKFFEGTPGPCRCDFRCLTNLHVKLLLLHLLLLWSLAVWWSSLSGHPLSPDLLEQPRCPLLSGNSKEDRLQLFHHSQRLRERFKKYNYVLNLFCVSLMRLLVVFAWLGLQEYESSTQAIFTLVLLAGHRTGNLASIGFKDHILRLYTWIWLVKPNDCEK